MSNNEKPKKYYNQDGTPKHIRCYEVKRYPIMDKYTVIFTNYHLVDSRYKGKTMYIGMGKDPSGMSYYGEAETRIMGGVGSRINFKDLPEKCKEAVHSPRTRIYGEITKKQKGI